MINLRYILLLSLLTLSACAPLDEGSTTTTATKTTPTVVFENKYPSDLVFEVWVGSALNYEKGAVYGFDHSKINTVEVKSFQRKEITLQKASDWLLVIGLDDKSNFYYFDDQFLENVADGAVIQVGEDGSISHLKASTDALRSNNTIDNNGTSFDLALLDDLKTAAYTIQTEAVNIANFANNSALHKILQKVLDNSITLSASVPTSWVDDSLGRYTYSANNVSLKSQYLWGDNIKSSSVGIYTAGDKIPLSVFNLNNFFGSFSTSFTGDTLQLNFSSAGLLAPLFAVLPGAASPITSNNATTTLAWFTSVASNLTSSKLQTDLSFSKLTGSNQVDINLRYLSSINIKVIPKLDIFKSEVSLKTGLLPLYFNLDTSKLNVAKNANYQVTYTGWSLIVDPVNNEVKQTITFTAKSNSDAQLGFKGSMYLDKQVSSATNVNLVLEDLAGKPIK